jgi:hypothetical protein
VDLLADAASVMNREEIDRALERLRDERDRIATALLDLENHPGYQLLKGTALTGMTKERWTAIQTQAATLWGLFDAYRRQLELAEEIRAQQAKPSTERLAELTRLLNGPSVEPPGGEIPLEKRSLLGPPTERLTFDAVVGRMTALYDSAADAVANADAVWSSLLARLEEVEEAARAVTDLFRGMEAYDPDLERISQELTRLRAVIISDPLSLEGQGTEQLDKIAKELGPLRQRLEEAARIRDEHATRLHNLGQTIELVRTAEADARGVRAIVQVKISNPVPAEPPDQARALADRLQQLSGLAGQGQWPELAGGTAALEREARTALDQARAAQQNIQGLLDRREELRGRLEAYKAKAARLGRSEDLELGRLYETAKQILWTAPCDLRQATSALAGYQRAITNAAEGAGR